MLLVNLSGRGDKDVQTVEQRLKERRRCRALTPRFATCATQGRTGLVTYVTAGDPDLERSREILVRLDRAGADVLEVGVPFSDPLADGPVIQRATERAIAAGTTLRQGAGHGLGRPLAGERADRDLQLRQPDSAHGPGRVRRRAPSRPASTAC